MDIDVREKLFEIANGLNLFINNRVMDLDWCKNVFFLSIFRTNGWILIKFCICIDIYKIHVVSNARYIWSIFNTILALDGRQNFVYVQYLVNLFVDFDQILYMHWQNVQIIFHYFSAELWPLIDVRILFPFNILRTNWCILMKLCVWVLWLSHKISPNFSTELWPLIDVNISIFLNIFRKNEWILIKFCLLLIYMIHGVTNTHYFLNFSTELWLI